MAQQAGQVLQHTAQHELFEEEQYAVINAPEQKRPVCAVPDAGQQPDEQQVRDGAYRPGAAAAAGNIDIVAEPRAERGYASAAQNSVMLCET